jgi:beta-galactosidase
MRTPASRLLLPLLAFACGIAFAADGSPRRVENFNRDWKFSKGAQAGAETAAFDDSAWEAVRLPHDWAIRGPYDIQGEPRSGKLPWRGEAWYRKSFSLPVTDAGKRVYLDFDGVMAMPTVYVNGKKAGGWDYGYVAFRVDVTDYIQTEKPNVVAVHVDTRTHFSRWYPGAGIYRDVRLIVNEPVHVANWGVSITTPEVTAESATVQVQTTVENHTDAATRVEVETILRDPQGKQVATQTSPIDVPARSSTPVVTRLTVTTPKLWDIDSPQRYTATTRVFSKGRLLDGMETPFGIRTFEFTADDGFHLNGRRVQVKGVNLHSDLGPLGMAFNLRAAERQLEIMKDMGVNAVRTAHNPPASGFLELCDRMGILVWNEVFDKWDATSTIPESVSIPEHGKKQITNFILRDRNHPCIVVWSVGNEISPLEKGTYPDATGLLKTMVAFVKDLDSTRPVGLGQCEPESARSPIQGALDVAGWNYAARYTLTRELWPKLPIVYSESASALSTRGYYDDFPLPRKKDVFPATARTSSYDHNSAWYSDPADVEFALMEKDRFVAGEFVWTGFDYIGEPNPFIAEGRGAFSARKLSKAEESRISSFGIVDLVGIPKDRYFLYRSYWAPEKKTIHILPHWNWPERLGKNTPVYVYTNGDSAELFLNGTSLGRRTKDPKAEAVRDRYALRWLDVPYQPGELKAVAYQNGRELGTTTVRTAGEPTALRLTPDRTTLKADGEDLSFVLVEAVDADGNLCPLAMNEVKFDLKGPATIAGVGNGDHHYPAEFVSDRVALFYGKAMLIVRTDDGPLGNIRITATSEGMRKTVTPLEAR